MNTVHFTGTGACIVIAFFAAAYVIVGVVGAVVMRKGAVVMRERLSRKRRRGGRTGPGKTHGP